MAEELRTRFLVAAGFALSLESPSLGSVIGKKLRQKAGKSILNRFCDQCGLLAVPGETSNFQVKKGKIHKQCRYCNKFNHS